MAAGYVFHPNCKPEGTNGVNVRKKYLLDRGFLKKSLLPGFIPFELDNTRFKSQFCYLTLGPSHDFSNFISLNILSSKITMLIPTY